MGNRTLFLFIGVWFINSIAIAQPVQVDSSFHEKYNHFGIHLTTPTGYEAFSCYTIWGPNKTMQHRLSIFDVVAFSPDRNCMIFYSAFVNKLLQKGEDSVDGRLRYIAREIMEAQDILDSDYRLSDLKGAFFWAEDYITTVAGTWVKKGFNADKIFLYSLPLANSDFRVNRGYIPASLDSFQDLIRLYFVKEGGYYYDLLMLLTETGSQKKWLYLNDLNGHLLFDEEQIIQKWERIP